ncbi:glutamine--fructose-6-phosphate aminotransferase [Candidatus Woesebacteria bacterium RIFCSPLOWO2_01_FULL_39_61]|uniref:Glutamine--fructose-6-phosphate aminotransferase [isomerizing] n=1 Tax=Candidatus Woesebacteria bacterium RIFCSPHIGHO2_02_FULL_39_13 TaxID=1802505 RepID=A0A1F7Z0X9_9BACT|nr:MAG: glutamine--fructose-6-phosphate aminotransferase [Candidatus Woesebacteria bacterium RIFCSPHIGHO2_01_FULL_39_95]OGM32345.1 MAG: glutamine--fructose-6-phosphate aminotransferase [Candidatus Woesebacteria bacterium RIFCSPHIGHO2_02_FULL_39_13]OGM37031.1 MAG: glutamine--fructose-6-phosphate aminotransferase [Candidatus Woesebacteria bacterium RIFCSPHIGHO2_12_FULL_40_20]OGM67940.1 MAG: glutamine--fructose-6-phosphate aminotransferase [Candidatus Woesebacteria bacterium RIFCSPLOWO2_01_FULL_39_
MCGIFGYIGRRKNSAQIVFDGIKSLEYRGYDSWGVAVVADSKIYIKKRKGKIGEANIGNLPKGNISMGHTRWATHGGVTNINAHPHSDCSGKIAVIHNGIFENYEASKEKLVKEGHKIISETDTEVLAHLIESCAKRLPFTKAVNKAFNMMNGLNAIIVLNADDNKLVAIRNGSPLVIGFGKGENFLASDAAALLPHTKKVYFLGDYELAEISADGVIFSDAKNGKNFQPKIQTLNWQVSQTKKGKYPNFMEKEIYEQPEIITDIAVNSPAQAKRMGRIIKKSYGAYLVGCGSASYVSLAGSYLFAKIAKRHINWAIGSEFGYHLDFLTPKSLVIAISQSGETMDILESVKKAKESGAKIFALVNVLGSTLYREADYKMLIGAGPEKSVASTKVVTGKLAILTLLAYSIAGNIKKGQAVVMKAAKSSKKVLEQENIARLKKLARRLKGTEDIYVIGRGLSYPASLETAMKIKEITYIHAEGMAAGELKHGPLALVEKGTPCIAFLPDDETYGANLAGAMEMKARGGYIVGISYKPHELFDSYLPVDDAEEATIIPNIITGQMIAYLLTIELGLDPDMPRNLAKSVTVK